MIGDILILRAETTLGNVENLRGQVSETFLSSA